MIDTAVQQLLLDPFRHRFRVESIISESGQGTVVKALDTRLGRTVAIKSLQRGVGDLEASRLREARMAREVEAFSRIRSHPHILTIYDFVTDSASNASYLTLDYAAGGTLAIRQVAGALPLGTALQLAKDFASGLQAAHDADIVHGDIKPSNLFISAEGRGLVGDFGGAQFNDEPPERAATLRAQTNSLRYMSPEHERASGFLPPASDQYGLGLVLFEMVIGRPFKRTGSRDGNQLLFGLPPVLAPIVQRMTMPLSDDRYPTMNAVVRALEAAEHRLGLPAGAAAGGGAAPVPTAAQQRVLGPAAVPPKATAAPAPASAAAPLPAGTPAHASRRRPLALLFAGITLLGVLGGGLIVMGAGQQRTDREATARAGTFVAVAPTPTVPLAAPLLAPSATIAPTAAPATIAPATVAPPTAAPLNTPTPVPTVAPTAAPTATATAVPTATPLPPPVIGVFGLGTVARADLDPVAPENVVATFTIGQEVFAFVNFAGARPGVDHFDLTLVANNVAQAPIGVTLVKEAGFQTAPFGRLPLGTYRVELRRDGTLQISPWSFTVVAPSLAPTATTAPAVRPAPTVAPQPVVVPVVPTATPRPAPAPQPTPVPAPPPQPTPAPAVPAAPTQAPRPTPLPGG